MLRESISQLVCEVVRASDEFNQKTREFVEQFAEDKFFSVPWYSDFFDREVDDEKILERFTDSIISGAITALSKVGHDPKNLWSPQIYYRISDVVRTTLERLFATRKKNLRLPKSVVDAIGASTEGLLDDRSKLFVSRDGQLSSQMLDDEEKILSDIRQRVLKDLREKLGLDPRDWAELVNSGAVDREIKRIVKRERSAWKKLERDR